MSITINNMLEKKIKLGAHDSADRRRWISRVETQNETATKRDPTLPQTLVAVQVHAEWEIVPYFLLIVLETWKLEGKFSPGLCHLGSLLFLGA